jgi:ATP phosphoribosyltransferase regulatory subunit HisZ
MTHEEDPTATRLTDHLIEAAVMKARLEHVEAMQQNTNHQVLQAVGGIAADVKAIRTDLSTVPGQIQTCRAEIRREIERDFPNKEEALKMERRIEEQIEHTDRALGVQIAEVKTSLGEKINLLSGEIQTVKYDVSKIWIKVAASVIAVVATAGAIMWLMDFVEKLPK